jgi:hypothetical protein
MSSPGQTAVAGALAGSQPVLQPGGSWDIHAPGAVSSNGHPLMVNSPQAIANNPAGVAAGLAAAGQPAAPQPQLRGAYGYPASSPSANPNPYGTYSGTEGHYIYSPPAQFRASGYQKGQPVDGVFRQGAQQLMPAGFHPPPQAKPQNFGFMGMHNGQPVEYDSNAHRPPPQSYQLGTANGRRGFMQNMSQGFSGQPVNRLGH